MSFGLRATFSWLWITAAMLAGACGSDEVPDRGDEAALSAPMELRAAQAGEAPKEGVEIPPPESSLMWSQQTKLLAGDGVMGDNFGWSAAISGSTAVVGATNDDGQTGSAYVFVGNQGAWTQQAKLLANDATAGNLFGYSVAISGETALVGAIYDDDKGIYSGSVYVFVRSGAAWSQQAKIVAADGAASDWFGTSVAIEGDTAIIGAAFDDDKGEDSGAAYVYVRSGAAWALQAKIVPADGASDDCFGGGVAIAGNTAVVGAFGDTDKGNNAGSVYVFTRSGAVWTQQAKLLASDGGAFDRLGGAVAIANDTIIAGADGDDDKANEAGAAYIFVRNQGVWTQQAKLVASDGAALDAFGEAVGISGDTAIAGSGLDDDKGDKSGAAYLFVRSQGAWTEAAKLVASDGQAVDRLGASVAISGDTALAGAYTDDDKGADSGSAYVWAPSMLAAGSPCASGMSCASGFCVDGVCCQSLCGGSDSGDCQACSVAAGAALDGTCSVRSAGAACRAGAGACDLAESCDGTTTACPANLFVAAGTECRASAGDCDLAESCNGASAACPSDSFVAAGTECRAAAGDCDLPESCDGATAACPANTFVMAGTECRASAGVCDVAESCDGIAAACPADALEPGGAECRAAAGECDLAESCDGVMAECPADAVAPDGTSCSEGTCAGGVCGGGGGSGSGGAGGTGSGTGGAGGIGSGSGGASSGEGAGGSTSDPGDDGGCACDLPGARTASGRRERAAISPALALLALAFSLARRRQPGGPSRKCC
jgi:hypothetical protein